MRSSYNWDSVSSQSYHLKQVNVGKGSKRSSRLKRQKREKHWGMGGGKQLQEAKEVS